MLFWSQIGISVFGCAAFLMVTRETRRLQVAGTVCGLISNPFWWMMVIATQQWITIPLHAAYTYGWLSKAYRLWRSRPRYDEVAAIEAIRRIEAAMEESGQIEVIVPTVQPANQG